MNKWMKVFIKSCDDWLSNHVFDEEYKKMSNNVKFEQILYHILTYDTLFMFRLNCLNDFLLLCFLGYIYRELYVYKWYIVSSEHSLFV